MVEDATLTLSTGIDSLDRILDGLLSGDNVVWVGERSDLHDRIETAFLSEGDGPKAMVVMTGRPAVPAGVEVIDARPGRPDADAGQLEQKILSFGQRPGARIVIRDLDNLVRRLGPERALGFFTRTCPRLFDLGALAYWRSSRAGSGAILGQIQGVTQCVLEHTDGRLRVIKAESRPGIAGRIYDIASEGEGLEFTEVKTLSRLAEGIRRLRTSRGLTQTEMARMAAVSQSAIAQAESGHRGLNLDTLLTLGEALGVSLDELLDYRPRQGYVVARRDRIRARRGVVPLLDDPDAGLRAFLVRLGAGESGSPATIHKGAELILVGNGVVQIHLNEHTPVLRAGDALLVTHDAINGWRNLLPEPARLFWIVRD
jgi:transcriptional regulator with XRE-family HTH domain